MRITTIDAHTAGEPLRVITGGFPPVQGDSILAMRAYAREHCDHVRTALMFEPRGHADMYGCLLVPAPTDDGDIGVLFLHNEGYSTMCGHGIIALVKVGLEHDLFQPADESAIRIDTPAGRVTARAVREGDRVVSVVFENVPSFVLESQLVLDIDGVDEVVCDIAFGGAFYAYVDAASCGLTIDGARAQEIIDIGMRIKHAVMKSYSIVHPAGDPDLNFLYGTILHEAGKNGAHTRNACVFAEGELDRSPTGTGVSGWLAVCLARGVLSIGDSITIESILGTRFDVKAAHTCNLGPANEILTVIPEVTGSAFITGHHEFVIDPHDPLKDGFLLGR